MNKNMFHAWEAVRDGSEGEVMANSVYGMVKWRFKKKKKNLRSGQDSVENIHPLPETAH